jgi:surfeit locus 1 family protein
VTPRARDVVGLVIAVTVAAGCARLGVWQLDRLQQRRARNAQVRAARERPAVEARAGLPADSAASRRVHAAGRYDYAHQQLWRARSYEGVPGVALMTPLLLADGSAVFVDRGWAPSPDAAHVDEQAYREPDMADVLGLGFPAPRGRGDVDPARLQDSLPYPVLPFILQQLPPSTALYRPLPPLPPLPPGLIRWPPPPLDDGPHLSYAIQWFCFALIILVGSAVLLGKSRGAGREATNSSSV